MATDAKLHIGLADHGRPLTLEEYLDADVDPGLRCELARGILEVTHVPRSSHGMIVHVIYKALTIYELAHPGRIRRFGGAGEFHFVLPGLVSGRNPDIAVVLAGAAPDLDGDPRASLAMEVVSPGARARERDHVAKREEYLAFGLDEYWIIDPFERKVIVLCRRGDIWQEQAFVSGQEATGRVLPGFRVALDALWAAYDGGGVDAAGEA